MKTFKQWCRNLLEAMDRGIIIHHQGPTPKQVDQQGGWSVWYWDENAEKTPQTLKVSFPIKEAVPLPSNDEKNSHIRMTDSRGVVYTATSNPSIVATLVKQVRLMNQEAQSSSNVVASGRGPNAPKIDFSTGTPASARMPRPGQGNVAK
jgi:hypothetical protein